FYPIPEKGCIYSPQVIVIKDQDYHLLSKPFEVAMVACAALRHPILNKQGKYSKIIDYQLMKHKIQQIFQVAYQHKHDALVLSAFGCGAFKNPPEVVAQIFNEVIAQYKGCFKVIIFAIKSHHD